MQPCFIPSVNHIKSHTEKGELKKKSSDGLPVLSLRTSLFNQKLLTPIRVSRNQQLELRLDKTKKSQFSNSRLTNDASFRPSPKLNETTTEPNNSNLSAISNTPIRNIEQINASNTPILLGRLPNSPSIRYTMLNHGCLPTIQFIVNSEGKQERFMYFHNISPSELQDKPTTNTSTSADGLSRNTYSNGIEPLNSSMQVSPNIQFASNSTSTSSYKILTKYENHNKISSNQSSSPPTVAYFKIMGNKKLVRTILESNGLIPSSHDSMEFSILWCNVQLKNKILQSQQLQLHKYQKINIFPRSWEITRKDSLCKNINKMIQTHGNKQFSFMPECYVYPEEKHLLEYSFKHRPGPWIVKPAGSSQGKGIFITDNIKKLPNIKYINNNPYVEKNTKNNTNTNSNTNIWVVERYISNPLLINGVKFDLRLYVLVTSFHPLKIYLHNEGLARFATELYRCDKGSYTERYAHLTNYSLNKNNIHKRSHPSQSHPAQSRSPSDSVHTDGVHTEVDISAEQIHCKEEGGRGGNGIGNGISNGIGNGNDDERHRPRPRPRPRSTNSSSRSNSNSSSSGSSSNISNRSRSAGRISGTSNGVRNIISGDSNERQQKHYYHEQQSNAHNHNNHNDGTEVIGNPEDNNDNSNNNYMHIDCDVDSDSDDSDKDDADKDVEVDVDLDDEEDNTNKIKMSFEKLKGHLRSLGVDTELLWEKIEELIVKTLISIEMKVILAQRNLHTLHPDCCFQLFGFDVLIDSEINPWLLEVNLSPSLNTDSPLDIDVKSQVISDLFNLIGIRPRPATNTAPGNSSHNNYSSSNGGKGSGNGNGNGNGSGSNTESPLKSKYVNGDTLKRPTEPISSSLSPSAAARRRRSTTTTSTTVTNATTTAIAPATSTTTGHESSPLLTDSITYVQQHPISTTTATTTATMISNVTNNQSQFELKEKEPYLSIYYSLEQEKGPLHNFKDSEKKILINFCKEIERSRGYKLIFPNSNSFSYRKLFEEERPMNDLLGKFMFFRQYELVKIEQEKNQLNVLNESQVQVEVQVDDPLTNQCSTRNEIRSSTSTLIKSRSKTLLHNSINNSNNSTSNNIRNSSSTNSSNSSHIMQIEMKGITANSNSHSPSSSPSPSHNSHNNGSYIRKNRENKSKFNDGDLDVVTARLARAMGQGIR